MRQGLPARLVIALFAVALLASAVVASAAEAPTLPSEFTDDYGGRYYVTSNRDPDWAIRGSSAEPKLVEWLRQPSAGRTDPLDRQGLGVLWARKCETGKQMLHLRRSFNIAGPEHSLGAALQAYTQGRATFQSVELRVNGIRILKTKGNSTESFDATDKNLKRLRFGRNNIEVIAVKRANPRGVKCNTRASNKLGVAFHINGEFGSDTGLLEPAAGDSKHSVAGAQTVNQTLNFEVRNNGPGGAAGMGFNLTLAIPRGGGTTTVVKPKPEGKARSCDVGSYTGDVAFNPAISCKIANVAAGERVVIPIQVAFALPDRPFKQVTMYMDWSTRQGGRELGNTGNNSRQAKVTYCDSDATEPPCK